LAGDGFARTETADPLTADWRRHCACGLKGSQRRRRAIYSSCPSSQSSRQYA